MPSGIALHDRLEALDLRNNRLDTIPPEWTNAPTTLVAQAPLVYLRIAGNQFTVRVLHAGRARSASAPRQALPNVQLPLCVVYAAAVAKLAVVIRLAAVADKRESKVPE